MLGWVRGRLRPVALVLLASLAGVGGASSAGHPSDCHDDHCAVAAFPHDPDAHRIGSAASETEHPLHCVLCHWTRIVRPSTDVVHHLSRPVTDVVLPHSEVLGALSPSRAAQPPLRSPPLV